MRSPQLEPNFLSYFMLPEARRRHSEAHSLLSRVKEESITLRILREARETGVIPENTAQIINSYDYCARLGHALFRIPIGNAEFVALARSTVAEIRASAAGKGFRAEFGFCISHESHVSCNWVFNASSL